MAQINTTFSFKDQMTQGLSLLNNTLTSMNKTLSSMQNQMSGTNQAINEVRRSSEQAADSVGGLSSGLLNFNAAVGVFNAVKGAVDSVTASINEMSEAYNYQMTQESKLSTVMRARMGATEEQIQSIKNYASALQNTGVIGDEAQLAGAQELATYISDVNTLKALMPVLNDIAVQASPDMKVNGQQMANLATMLGKVMGGDLGGMSRRGWVFTEEEKARFKEMSEMQRAQFLAAYAQDAIGSQNQDAAQTAAGQVIQLTNTFGDLKEQLGQALVPYQQFFQISTMQWKIKFIETLTKGLNTINKHPLLKALVTGAIVAAFTAIGVIIVSSVIPALAGIVAKLTIIQAFSGPIGWVALAIGAVVAAAVTMEGAFNGTADKLDDCANASKVWAENISDVKTDMDTIKSIINDTSSWGINTSQEAMDAYRVQLNSIGQSLDSMLGGYSIDWRKMGLEELQQALKDNSFSRSEIKMVERLVENYDEYNSKLEYALTTKAQMNAALAEEARLETIINQKRQAGSEMEAKIASAYEKTKKAKEDAQRAELEEFQKMYAAKGYELAEKGPYGGTLKYSFHAFSAEEMSKLEVIIKELKDSFKKGSNGALVTEDKGLVDIATDYRELLSKQATERFNLRFSQVTPQVTFGDVNINSEKDGENIFEKIVGKMEELESSYLGG